MEFFMTASKIIVLYILIFVETGKQDLN